MCEPERLSAMCQPVGRGGLGILECDMVTTPRPGNVGNLKGEWGAVVIRSDPEGNTPVERGWEVKDVMNAFLSSYVT